ncbi:MAG: class I SAM-dependent methyltransferase [Pseudomonadota bacterium]
MTTNAHLFGGYASAYNAGRPGYPDALFDWVAEAAPGRAAVWDVGTGSGQAALSLAERFDHVFAIDASADQIAEAPEHAKITFRVAPAEASGLAGGSVDAVTVATALHWFDFPRFWAEVRRVCRPGAVFCGFTYGLTEADDATHRLLLDPVLERIDPYWSAGNKLSLRGYQPEEIGFPFAPLDPPPIRHTLQWSPERLVQFMRTWSAHVRALDDGLRDEITAIEEAALAALGSAERTVVLPMTVRAGRVC